MCMIHICLFCWQVTHFLPYLSTLWSSPTWLSIWQPCGILKAGRLWSFHPLRIKTSDYSLKDYILKARPLNHRMITAKIWLKRTGTVFSTYFHDDKSNVVLECVVAHMWCVKVHCLFQYFMPSHIPVDIMWCKMFNFVHYTSNTVCDHLNHECVMKNHLNVSDKRKTGFAKF